MNTIFNTSKLTLLALLILPFCGSLSQASDVIPTYFDTMPTHLFSLISPDLAHLIIKHHEEHAALEKRLSLKDSADMYIVSVNTVLSDENRQCVREGNSITANLGKLKLVLALYGKFGICNEFGYVELTKKDIIQHNNTDNQTANPNKTNATTGTSSKVTFCTNFFLPSHNLDLQNLRCNYDPSSKIFSLSIPKNEIKPIEVPIAILESSTSEVPVP